MAELPDEAVEMFNNENCEKDKPLIWVSTVGTDSIPHAVPVCFGKVIDKDKILLSVNFITQTTRNIKMGSMVSVSVAVPYDGYMAVGNGQVLTSGELFDDSAERVKKRFGGKIEPKAAILVEVQRIFRLVPKPGKKEIT
ncbi:MAG TPA: pyridoxamine 5'-phosphate oxidase family protein [Candidatus Methylomirabilis sp.]|nr:pyridoxamine 5'-phosphate oxidase family protein [Candidatus Methylomirabilis sp.]